MSQGTSEKAWISGAAAAAILDCHPITFRKIADEGAISTKQLPGRRRLYSRADVERLAHEAITPAQPAVA